MTEVSRLLPTTFCKHTKRERSFLKKKMMMTKFFNDVGEFSSWARVRESEWDAGTDDDLNFSPTGVLSSHLIVDVVVCFPYKFCCSLSSCFFFFSLSKKNTYNSQGFLWSLKKKSDWEENLLSKHLRMAREICTSWVCALVRENCIMINSLFYCLSAPGGRHDVFLCANFYGSSMLVSFLVCPSVMFMSVRRPPMPSHERLHSCAIRDLSIKKVEKLLRSKKTFMWVLLSLSNGFVCWALRILRSPSRVVIHSSPTAWPAN